MASSQPAAGQYSGSRTYNNHDHGKRCSQALCGPNPRGGSQSGSAFSLWNVSIHLTVDELEDMTYSRRGDGGGVGGGWLLTC